jgi:uncharacterized protein (TIGR03086 family)
VDRIERIERATSFAAGKVEHVTAAEMSKPTPCPDFDVRTLLNHMIGNLRMLAVAAEGGKAAIPKGDQFGTDPGGAYNQRRDALLGALRSPGVLDRNWEMPFGSMAGNMMAGIAFMEHLTHGWDLAKATDQDTSMPSDLVSECMELVTSMESLLRTPGVCGPAVSVSEDASVDDKFIAFMGRKP